MLHQAPPSKIFQITYQDTKIMRQKEREKDKKREREKEGEGEREKDRKRNKIGRAHV